MFQPNAGGHQPFYFDQLAALYNHYTVVRSKCTIQLLSTNSAQAVACLYIDDDATISPTNIYAICEQNSSNYALVPPAGSGSTITLRKSWSATEAFGGDPMSNDNLQGTISSNPLEEQKYAFCVQDAAGAVASIKYAISIEYDAVWDELKNVQSS